jgi:hypothetical protein
MSSDCHKKGKKTKEHKKKSAVGRRLARRKGPSVGPVQRGLQVLLRLLENLRAPVKRHAKVLICVLLMVLLRPVQYPLVIVSQFPDDPGGASRSAAVEEVRRGIAARFVPSQTEVTGDPKSLANLREEGRLEGAALLWVTTGTGSQRRFRLVPVGAGALGKGVEILDRLPDGGVTSLPELPEKIKWAIHVSRAEVAMARGMTALAIEEIQSVLKRPISIPDSADLQQTLEQLLTIGATTVSPSDAREVPGLYLDAVSKYRISGRDKDRRDALVLEALNLLAAGDAVAALKAIDEARADLPFDGNRLLFTKIVVNRATVLGALPEPAVEEIESAIADLELASANAAPDTPRNYAGALKNALAMMYVSADNADANRIRAGIELFGESLDIYTRLQQEDPSVAPQVAAVKDNLANALAEHRSGDRPSLDRAADLASDALTVRTKEAGFWGWSGSSLVLSRVYLGLGKLTGEQHYIELSVSTSESLLREPFLQRNPFVYAKGTELLGEANSAWEGPGRESHLERARTLFEQAAKTYEAAGYKRRAEHARSESARLIRVLRNAWRKDLKAKV